MPLPATLLGRRRAGRGHLAIQLARGPPFDGWRFVRRSTIGIQEGASKQLWTGSGPFPLLRPSPSQLICGFRSRTHSCGIRFGCVTGSLRDFRWSGQHRMGSRWPDNRYSAFEASHRRVIPPPCRGSVGPLGRHRRMAESLDEPAPTACTAASQTYPSSSMLAWPVRLAATTKPQQCLRIARPTARDCLPRIRTASVFVQHPLGQRKAVGFISHRCRTSTNVVD
jgi:hypothetical protein